MMITIKLIMIIIIMLVQDMPHSSGSENSSLYKAGSSATRKSSAFSKRKSSTLDLLVFSGSSLWYDCDGGSIEWGSVLSLSSQFSASSHELRGAVCVRACVCVYVCVCACACTRVCVCVCYGI